MPSTSKVVDIGAYRADQLRRRLPLFDPPAPEAPAPGTQATLRFEPAAALSSRQVAHRARMLEHLNHVRAGSAGRFQAPR